MIKKSTPAVSYSMAFADELSSFQVDLERFIRADALSENAEAFYADYLQKGNDLLAQGLDPILLEKGTWDEKFNFRKGANSIHGTRGEMYFEVVCYLAGLKVEERVSNKKRQVYGEDFVVTARKVSVKARRLFAAIFEGQKDLNVYLYQSDFKPAVWRVDVLALVDVDTDTVATLNYRKLAEHFCNIDAKGLCTPKFSEYRISVSLAEITKLIPNCVTITNLATELKAR